MALQHEKEALEAQCAALSIQLKDKKEGESMLLELMESKGTIASNAQQLHDKTLSDLTEAKLAHRSEVDLLRTELVDALEAQDTVQQEKDGQVQELAEALAESNALRVAAEEAAAQYQSRVREAESEAASLRDELARVRAEHLELRPEAEPDTGSEQTPDTAELDKPTVEKTEDERTP